MYLDHPVSRQFGRAWNDLRVRTPERCTEAFIKKWFQTLDQQGVVKDFVIDQDADGFDVGFEDDAGDWHHLSVEKP